MKTIFYFFILISFLGHAQTYVPDDNFEQALIDLGYDDVLDDYVDTENIISVSNLDVHGKNINNLMGIEDFESIETLKCYANNITNIDLTNNMLLKHLECQNNDLSILNLNNNVLLEYLNCNFNELTSLNVLNNYNLKYIDFILNQLVEIDISNCLLLEEFHCSSNYLTTIDISLNEDLTIFGCSDNLLSSIDLSNNLNINQLKINNNQLTSINISTNINLYALECQNNLLTEIDISNNPLYVLLCNNNQLINLDIRNGVNDNILNMNATNNLDLKCIFVDDIVLTNPDNWYIDGNTHFVETEVQCGEIGTDDISKEDISFYPNPTNNTFIIQGEVEIKKVSLYNSNGSLLNNELINNNGVYSINMESGIYFIRIETDNDFYSKKIIVM